MTTRPTKVIRLNYWKSDPEYAAHISILADPAEVRISASPKTFVSVHAETGVSISPGTGNNINIQALSSQMTFAGMVQELPFPLALIPNTPFTSFPAQMIKPPFMNLIGKIGELATMAASMVG